MYINYGDKVFFEYGCLVDAEHEEGVYHILCCNPYPDEPDQFQFGECEVGSRDGFYQHDRKESQLPEGILEGFLSFYEKVCEDYILKHRDYSGIYFQAWYQSTGKVILDDIREQVTPFSLDKRVQGFVNLYQHYISAAMDDEDNELLLENLYAVPEQMRHEFLKFGFFTNESVKPLALAMGI